jgi:dihydrofolate synthase/folylpolyglutamate synthase
VLCESRPDALVLEVGMGGRTDAVNVLDADCALITSVDIDHAEFLGPDRESIGLEKAGVFRTGRPAIVSDPQPPQSMIDRAREIEADLWLFGRDFNYAGDRQQWSWAGRSRRYNGLAYPALRGANQLLNAAGVLAALESLRDRLPVNAQAVRTGLAGVELPGRFQIVPGQPTLVLDVAHNPHSVATLAVNLDQMGFYPRTHAVFGAMRDKDIAGMLSRMAGLVDAWHFCDLPTPRAATAKELETLHREMQLKGSGDGSVQSHAGPTEALRFALAGADPADRIVVFGSFYTVGGVLKEGLPRLGAAHLG